MAVLLVGTLDTKGVETDYVRQRLRAAGVPVLVADAGVFAPPFAPDIPREAVFAAAGTTLAEVVKANDRGRAVAAAAKGIAAVAAKLHREGKLAGVLGLGGSAGTTIGTAAMRAVPVGVPKVMVSTLASGDVRPYVGTRDVMMLYSVVDIAGLNRVSRLVLTNAANAMAGMILGKNAPPRSSPSARIDLPHEGGGGAFSVVPQRGIAQLRPASPLVGEVGAVSAAHPTGGGEINPLPVIAATMFGVTTPCVEACRAQLEPAFEVLTFHATGTGGRTMEGLIRDGLVNGVLDLTTTELADELVGGVMAAGPDRLTAAAIVGVPQVISVGALDMVNFGPPESVPEKFRDRRFHHHNPTVTLMRTTPEENDRLGKEIAEKACAARGPTAILLPLRGVSAIDRDGGPFWWPEANAALFQSLRNWVYGVDLIEIDCHINDPAFADAAVATLRKLMG